MQVRTAQAPASAQHDGHQYSFCSERCRERFELEPERYLNGSREPSALEDAPPGDLVARDPICAMEVSTLGAKHTRRRGGTTFYFCGPGCAQRFDSQAPEGLAPPPGTPEHR